MKLDKLPTIETSIRSLSHEYAKDAEQKDLPLCLSYSLCGGVWKFPPASGYKVFPEPGRKFCPAKGNALADGADP